MQLLRSDLALLAGLADDLAALMGRRRFTSVHWHGHSGDLAVRVPNHNQVAVPLTHCRKEATTAVLGRLPGVPSGTARLMPSIRLALVLAP